MEAAVINLLAPGEHAIFVNGGKFGERWGKMLATFGMVPHEVKVEWGRAVRPEQIEDALKQHPEARAIFVQASETSTCAVHPIAAIGEIAKRRNVMLIVDGITSVGVLRAEDGRVGHRRAGDRQSEGADAAARPRHDRALAARMGSRQEHQDSALLLRSQSRAEGAAR